MNLLNKFIAVLLILVINICSVPIFVKAKNTIRLEAPSIEITTDKKSYNIYDVAVVTVKVYPTDNNIVENVNVEASLNNQLCSFPKNSTASSKEILFDDGLEYSFEVAISQKAVGLSFFQKIVLFFKRLFKKTILVEGERYNDKRNFVDTNKIIKFGSVEGIISVGVWYNGEIDDSDSDNDGLIDYIERINYTNPMLPDTDNDGLNDYEELVIIGTNPTIADTNGNGLNDYCDDLDNDGISNGEELKIGTNANSADTDCDGLDDKVEISIYHTDPQLYDTDGDGASDGWEVENGYNPTVYDKQFKVVKECSNDCITAKVSLTTTGKNAETVSVKPVINNSLIDSSIPGYLGSAFEIDSKSMTGIAYISFEFDENLLEKKDFQPTIYCFNEETQSWYEYETTVVNNIATAQSTHFSKYILLNKNVYERALKESYKIDYSLDSGIDSNADGISDYVTKLMCDGILRTGTGTKVFGNYTFEQIQSNDDIDGDGIINGDEINSNYTIDIPNDSVEYNGHYYKLYDIGYVWDDAESFCESIGGYLMTITSQQEQTFAEKLLKGGTKNSYWLGSREKNRVYSWVTGEEFTYSNWAYNQPDNHKKSDYEDCLMIYNGYNPYSRNEIGEWNDLNNRAICGNEPFFGINNFGFICEWGEFEVGHHSYVFVNSSPIYSDTDKDGFEDCVDPTPNRADVFKSIKEYNEYYYNGKATVTFFARTPLWNTRTCMTTQKNNNSKYVTEGPAGHSFVAIKDERNNYNYFGFGGETNGTTIDYFFTALTRRKLKGILYDETYSKWTIGKTFVIDSEKINEVNKWVNEYKKSKDFVYRISKNNCTTFAVTVLNKLGIDVKIYEHKWQMENSEFMNLLSKTYFGYSPSDAAMDIRQNYYSYVACLKEYTLANGAIALNAVEAYGNPIFDQIIIT